MRKLLLPAIALVVFQAAVMGQPPGWNNPFPPHRVMDNVYFVGTEMLASFLITTPEGHILMNSNYESSVPLVRASVKELGFDFKEVKILISGHAHPDHVEGDALVKELTGAQVVVGRLEVPAVKAIRPGGKEHPIDRVVDDGDTVTLGGTTLTAHLTPGHTKGCLAWTMDLKEGGKTYHALIECSLNGQFLQYAGNKDYSEIVDDFRATFKKVREFPVDVFLSSHTVFYGMDQKYTTLKARREGDPNPFVDPEGYKAHVDQYEKIFESTLARQQAQAEGKNK